MEDILPDFKKQGDSRPPIFARLAFGVSILEVALCIIIFSSYPSTVQKIWGISIISLTRMALVSVVFGFGFSVISLVRKEKLKYLKLIGTILNFLLFAFFFVAVVFAFIMDLRRIY